MKEMALPVFFRFHDVLSAMNSNINNLIELTSCDFVDLIVFALTFQLPPWYSPPRKIPCLEKRSKNNTHLSAGISAPSAGHVDVLLRDGENILNPSSGFHVRGQNSGEITVDALASSIVAVQGMWIHVIQQFCGLPIIEL
jgi:hypothetical protein